MSTLLGSILQRKFYATLFFQAIWLVEIFQHPIRLHKKSNNLLREHCSVLWPPLKDDLTLADNISANRAHSTRYFLRLGSSVQCDQMLK